MENDDNSVFVNRIVRSNYPELRYISDNIHEYDWIEDYARDNRPSRPSRAMRENQILPTMEEIEKGSNKMNKEEIKFEHIGNIANNDVVTVVVSVVKGAKSGTSVKCPKSIADNLEKGDIVLTVPTQSGDKANLPSSSYVIEILDSYDIDIEGDTDYNWIVSKFDQVSPDGVDYPARARKFIEIGKKRRREEIQARYAEELGLDTADFLLDSPKTELLNE